MSTGGHVALPEMRELLFADLPPLTALERFAAVEPLRSLAEAALREDGAAARSRLESLLAAAGETRVLLQAWSIGRAAGLEPPAETAHVARGVVVEVGLESGTDTIAAYEDGSARYLNQGGGAIVWDTRDEAIDEAVRTLLAAAQVVADASGPLAGPRPGAPDQGYGAIWVLTEAGIHAGSGPFGTLAANRLGGPVVGAAIDLMRLLIERNEAAPRA